MPAMIPALVVLVASVVLIVHCGQPVHLRDKRSDDAAYSDSLGDTIMAQAEKLAAVEAEVLAAQDTISALKFSVGSSFTRWGRSTCPPDTTLLYAGFAGGSLHEHEGSGANRLCLTKEPVFDDTRFERYYGQLEGAQYYIPGHHYTSVMCAVCRTSRSVTYMVPGTNRCPGESVEQYHGYLTSGDRNNQAASEFLCLDSAPEDRNNSRRSTDSTYFEYVKTHCGSLPCPPYQDSKVVTCAVCSL